MKVLDSVQFGGLTSTVDTTEPFSGISCAFPPVYPNSSPDHHACNSLTPFRCPHAVHPCPSVDSGLGQNATCEHSHEMVGQD